MCRVTGVPGDLSVVRGAAPISNPTSPAHLPGEEGKPSDRDMAGGTAHIVARKATTSLLARKTKSVWKPS